MRPNSTPSGPTSWTPVVFYPSQADFHELQRRDPGIGKPSQPLRKPLPIGAHLTVEIDCRSHSFNVGLAWQAMPLVRRARLLALRQFHFLARLEEPQHRKADAAVQSRARAPSVATGSISMLLPAPQMSPPRKRGSRIWIPAFAGMTRGAGTTAEEGQADPPPVRLDSCLPGG
jgi:hypothetical protein